MIAYVYLVCLLILFLVRVTIAALVDLIEWSNAFGLRNAIARERGIAAHCAWVPFEKIRSTFLEKDGKRHLAASRMSAVGGNLGSVHYLG